MRALMLIAVLLQTTSTLYDRIEKKLAADPKLAAALSAAAPEMRDVRWLIGTWSVEARVPGTPRVDRGTSVVAESVGGAWLEIRDTYEGKLEDVGYLGYNAVAKKWISIGIDKTGNSVRSEAERWEGDRLPLIAENADVVGERLTLRQTIEKVSAREYRIVNEERLADGTWALIDEYVYRKK